jgi:leucyl aminopeptidase
MSLKMKLVSALGKADVLGVFIQEANFDQQLEQLPVKVDYLRQMVLDRKFKGAKSSVLCVPLAHADYKYLVLSGLGKAKNNEPYVENLRRAIAEIIRVCDHYSAKSLELVLPAAQDFAVTNSYLVEQAAVAAQLANHKFDTYLTDASKKQANLDVNLFLDASFGNQAELQAALDKANIMAQAVNQARQWIDLPANHLTPSVLADYMLAVAKRTGLKATVFDEEQIIKMGMGGIHAVSRGSHERAKFVLLEYSCGDQNAPTVALVGKGILYDTGGLSIKPAQSMETMKEDMAGAAAVVNAISVIAEFKPKVNVIACAPLAENMPSGTAGRPGDIISFYNGKTAEVKNTDAEGRLILADALSYVTTNYKLDAVVDIATLTGACEYALGNFFSALISDDNHLVAQMTQAGEISGDRVWRLPFTDDYKKAMHSNIADLSNIASGSFKAGTINGAVFLQNFVGDTPWAHLDIANTAYDLGMLPYYRADSATGVGVRLLVEFVMSFKK